MEIALRRLRDLFDNNDRAIHNGKGYSASLNENGELA
jgi:hypothetical protein